MYTVLAYGFLSSVEFASSTYVETELGAGGEESYARDGTWARCRSRAEPALVKYQGRAKISATLLDVYKRSSIFRVLSHGSAAVGFCAGIARGTGAKKRANLRKTCSPRKRDLRFYVWLHADPLPPSN